MKQVIPSVTLNKKLQNRELLPVLSRGRVFCLSILEKINNHHTKGMVPEWDTSKGFI